MTTVLAAVLTMMLNTGTASAATPSIAGGTASSAQTQATAECAAASETVETAATTDSPEMVLLDGEAAAAAVSQATSLAEAASITPQTPTNLVNYDRAKVYALNVDGVKATSVTFPTEGGSFMQPSNVSYVLDEAGQLSQYSESTVVEREDGLIDLNTYRDGVLVHSAQIDPSTLAAQQSAAANAMDPTTCLMAVLGVSAVVAGIILVLCGGSCSVPVTPPTATICAACIGGIAVVGGASIPAVMGCFNGG